MQENFEWVIGLVGLYFLIILGFVLYARVKTTNSFLPGLNEFFLAGKNLHPVILTCTFAGSLFSTFIVIGFPGLIYAHGIGALYFMVFANTLGLCIVFFLGKRLRQYAEGKRIFSPVEIISQSYDSRKLGLFMAVIFAVFLMPYISLQLVGIGTFVEAYTQGGITYMTGVGSMLAIVALYLFLGGMRAVAYTDFIQLVAIFIGLAAGMFYLLHHYDLSLLSLLETTKYQSPELLSLPGPKDFYTLSMLVTSSLVIVGIFMQPHLLTRTMMAKKDSDINFMVTGLTIGMILTLSFGFFYALFATSTFGADLKPNLMMGHIFEQMASFGFWGVVLSTLMLMGALGAAMSTSDSLLLAIGQVCTRDIARPFFQISPKKQVLLSKGIMMLVLLAAFFTGLNPPQFMTDLALYSAAGCVILMPTIICFGWKRRSLLASYVSITVGLILLAIMAAYKVIEGTTFLGVHVGFVPMATSFVLFFGISLLKKKFV